MIGGAFALIGAVPLLGGGEVRLWLLIVGAAIATVGLVRPNVLAPFNRVWTRLGILLSRITNPIVMGLMYFVVLTPAGLLMRLFGKDPLHRRIDPSAATYWIVRDPPGPAPGSMRDQF